MGKAVPRGIRARAEELLERFPDEFGTDFEKNKAFIDTLNLGFYKSTRNLIAGYLARVKHRQS